MPIMTKTMEITSELGFPTQVYFSMLGWLKSNGYALKKTDDWLYINPKTAQHADVMQRRAAIEQRLAQVMINIGDLRRDIELLKHDLRKFENALDHHRKNDLDVLKSDFMDFIDIQNQSNSMLNLARTGRFPTLVVDFERVKSEKEIDGLKISKSEKNILKVKWKIFEQWRASFSKGVEDRVRVLREEINSRQASLDNYKAAIRPYLEAIHKIKLSEEHPIDLLSNPTLIEGFMTSVAGVSLVAWRGVQLPGRNPIQPEREYKEGKKPYRHYIYFDIKIRRKQAVIKGKEIESMLIDIASSLATDEEIEKKEKEIKEREESILRSLEEFRGEREAAGPKPPPAKKEMGAIEGLARAAVAPVKIVGHYVRGELGVKSGNIEDILAKVVKDETIKFYDALKEMSGSLKFQRYPLEGR